MPGSMGLGVEIMEILTSPKAPLIIDLEVTTTLTQRDRVSGIGLQLERVGACFSGCINQLQKPDQDSGCDCHSSQQSPRVDGQAQQGRSPIMNVVTVTGSLGTVEATSVIALSSHSIDAQTVSPPIPLEKRRVRLVVDDPQQRELILKALLEIKTRIHLGGDAQKLSSPC